MQSGSKGSSFSSNEFYDALRLTSVVSEAVSHKLNNCLSGIIGYLQFAEEKMNRDHLGLEEIRSLLRYLDLAKGEALTSRNLMQNLRFLSRQYFEKPGQEFLGGRTKVLPALREFSTLLQKRKTLEGLSLEVSPLPGEEEDCDVSFEALYYLFYVLLAGLVQLAESGAEHRVRAAFEGQDETYLSYSFCIPCAPSLTDQEIEEKLTLFAAVVKSLYGCFQAATAEGEAVIRLSLPRKVERF